MQTKNPWTRERFEDALGDDESELLEFKSLEPHAGDFNEKWLNKLLDDEIYPAISAFLNSRGGTLLLGIAEQKDVKGKVTGHRLASMVPRSILDQERLHAKISGNIEPTPAGYVNVYPIRIDGTDDPLMGFAVEIREGHTAYQCLSKKIYYQRHGTRVEPMPDKNIRLRMLVDRVPLVSIAVRLEGGSAAERRLDEWRRELAQWDAKRHELRTAYEGGEARVNFRIVTELGDRPRAPNIDCEIFVDLIVRNVGSTTIREFAVEGGFASASEPSDLALDAQLISTLTPNISIQRFRYGSVSGDESVVVQSLPGPLYPDQEFTVGFRVLSLTRPQAASFETATRHELWFDTRVFLDNGPSVTARFDVAPRMREIVAAYLAAYEQTREISQP